MKNPYFNNIFWLIVLIFLAFFLPFFGRCYFEINSTVENILTGVISSAILLLILEIINFINDKKKYGFISGKYRKVFIAQRNPNGQRSSVLGEEFWRDENKKRIDDDSCYHELSFYDLPIKKYITKLKYQYNGIYTGTVQYFGNTETKVKAFVTLNLNLANRMIGMGSYKYARKDDFGKYEFQVDEENTRRIIVYYKNTIPSGLAEGYEIWEKIN
jgi:hypothetical protein